MLILRPKNETFMLKKYFILLPAVQGSFGEEWEQCLRAIDKSSGAGVRFLKMNIFCDLSRYTEYLDEKEKISKEIVGLLGEKSPAINVTIHPPDKPWKVIIEAVGILSDSNEVVTRFHAGRPYVVISSSSGKEVWGAGFGAGLFPENTRMAAEAAFEQVLEVLGKEGLTLNNIIRQWNYIGNILKVRDKFQSYQIFNEVRSEYYHKYRTVQGFPAATGVGMGLGGVILDFCAVEAGESVRIKPVSNPNQVNAYEYGQKVLKGMQDQGKKVKHPPQFERALMISNSRFSTLYVSGTASIIGQQTIGKNDVEKQTLVTIENIRKLADAERLSQITGNPEQPSEKYILLRVYIKRREDFSLVKEICASHFPDVPAVYIEADICRDDLLTEIEAELLLKP
jgi:enamine deaminase RidA (YjgF/YER057c/UK114 family)